MKLGFVGMGIMGSPMAQNLAKAGHDVTVFNRTIEKCRDAEAAGCAVAESAAATAEGAEIVLICVSDTPDVEDVLFGSGGLADALTEGQILVDHSTISPEATVDFAGRLEAKGVAMLDAPISGGQKGAIEAGLAIMVGGKDQAFDKAKSVFEAMGKNVVHCGPSGNGQRVKAVNQVICALNILAVSEGMLFAKRAGLDLETVHKVVNSGAAGSWLLNSLGPCMIEGDWDPGFMIKLQAKDLRIASAAMDASDAPHPGTALTTKLFCAAADEGLGEDGTQALAKLLGWDE